MRSRQLAQAAKHCPCLSEIIAVDYAIAIRAGCKGGIDSIMTADLDDAALEYLSRGYETALDTSIRGLIKKGIYLLGHLLHAPGLSTVRTSHQRKSVRVLTGGGRMPVYCISADKSNKNVLAFTVCHYGRIAIAAVNSSFDASAFNKGKLLTPPTSVWRKNLAPDIHSSESDIGETMSIVGKKHDRTILEFSQSRDSIRYTVHLTA